MNCILSPVKLAPIEKFQAFSDPIRLRILNLLRRGELCVCDLVEVLGVPQPTASRHLGHLRKANLVTVRKEGFWTFYSLAPASSDFHKTLLTCLDQCVNMAPALKSDQKRAAKLLKRGVCQ